MATFRERLPSRHDATLVFAVCAFPIHVWAILRLLNEIPAWLMRLSTWELIGATAYTLAYAMFETAAIFLLLTTLGFVLPAKFFRDKFVAQSSSVVLVSAGWALVAHLGLSTFWSMYRLLLAWCILLLASLTVSYLMIHWNRKLEGAIISLAERLLPVSFIYILPSILASVIVVLRNLFGRGA